MDALRIYLETTIFNRHLENGRQYYEETNRLFEKIAAGEVMAYTSAAVTDELNRAPSPKREQMFHLIADNNIPVLEVGKEADDLADIYVEMGIIPVRFKLDAVHIAMAAIHDMDCIISLNFHHINKLRTKAATEIVHRMKGYSNPFICTPTEVIYNDE
jgi:predicted nucleic acid-binding protein